LTGALFNFWLPCCFVELHCTGKSSLLLYGGRRDRQHRTVCVCPAGLHCARPGKREQRHENETQVLAAQAPTTRASSSSSCCFVLSPPHEHTEATRGSAAGEKAPQARHGGSLARPRRSRHGAGHVNRGWTRGNVSEAPWVRTAAAANKQARETAAVQCSVQQARSLCCRCAQHPRPC
jgi:hypothetical protein